MCCCCFLSGLVRFGGLAVQVLLVFLKLVLPLLILESMDLCPALESSPLAVPSRLCHHHKVRCRPACHCPNEITCLFPVAREVMTSCSCQVIGDSDGCVVPWLFSIDYLTSVWPCQIIPISPRRGKLCFDVCIKHLAAL